MFLCKQKHKLDLYFPYIEMGYRMHKNVYMLHKVVSCIHYYVQVIHSHMCTVILYMHMYLPLITYEQHEYTSCSEKK